MHKPHSTCTANYYIPNYCIIAHTELPLA